MYHRAHSVHYGEGIHHRLTVRDGSESNGICERMHLTIMNRVRAMVHARGLPVTMWPYAAKVAAMVGNYFKIVKRGDEEMSAWQAFTGKIPDISHLRVFGSPCMVHLPDMGNLRPDGKLSPRAARAVLIGYGEHRNQYRVLLLEGASTKTVVVSDAVSFYEADHAFQVADRDRIARAVKALIPSQALPPMQMPDDGHAENKDNQRAGEDGERKRSRKPKTTVCNSMLSSPRYRTAVRPPRLKTFIQVATKLLQVGAQPLQVVTRLLQVPLVLQWRNPRHQTHRNGHKLWKQGGQQRADPNAYARRQKSLSHLTKTNR